MRTHPLAGFTVGVTAGRRADEEIALLSGRGAECQHGPCAVARVSPADGVFRAQLDEVIATPPDVTVLTSGLGVQALFDGAEAHGLRDELREVIGRSDVVARGIDASVEAAVSDLDVTWTASGAGSTEVIDWLLARELDGRRVLIQADGDLACPYVAPCLDAGATVAVVRPYAWGFPEDLKPARRLVEAVADRRVDAVTFTSRPTVINFVKLADEVGLRDEVTSAFRNDVMLVSIGPVSSAAAVVHELGPSLQPPRWRLGSMVAVMTSAFMDRALELNSPIGVIRVQGCQLWLPGCLDPIMLTRRERSIVEALARRPGVVRSKRDLLDEVWGQVESNEHVVEVSVARLRKRLGPASPLIETVKRRGYRLWLGKPQI